MVQVGERGARRSSDTDLSLLYGTGAVKKLGSCPRVPLMFCHGSFVWVAFILSLRSCASLPRFVSKSLAVSASLDGEVEPRRDTVFLSVLSIVLYPCSVNVGVGVAALQRATSTVRRLGALV